MDKDMGKQILDTILEAGHGTSLLDALYDAAHELGTPEVYIEACEWLG